MNKVATEYHSLWNGICLELQKVISREAIEKWFYPIELIGIENDILILKAPDPIYQYWIEENYLPQVIGASSRILGKNLKVSFYHDQKQKGVIEKSSKQPFQEEKSVIESKGLNLKFSFENFVVGPNCEFAAAASKAVAESPAKAYNPLFLYGKVGLGKTHLMQAIGNYILKKNKRILLQYVTSEQFTNEFIEAIQKGNLVQFRKKYRQIDVLLIDDIQFLAGKERSQEEFFHTFNCLFDGSKQIVLSGDEAPSALQNLEKRLISRFEWGLTAEILPPGIEVRLAILKNKLKNYSISLEEKILEFIAERIKTNVRQLEGALNRLCAYISIHKREIVSLEEVESLLKDLISIQPSKTITIEMIQKMVCEAYDIRYSDMVSKRRISSIAFPRMVAMYLARKLTNFSLSQIGESFGGRDHGTVLHAQRTISEKMAQDPDLMQLIKKITERLTSSQ
ncbi:chromosomal replication initiator protein DnaA [Candidatus Methylacidiphilum fumarolicum]|uniref:Chromosomal replication initiator protein DnaA n=2 Tax=Candidatus Methylacidiphilum fumarolicum TaxID=591154 RepID=I0K1C6_METFB|nr:chromosomal replication initiator protein DnaA [Candidatus Methylacidiphilum fumarolicum]MBW6414949.1 chromosomal replication initiator protein DnaA [Candidatus Methylacidiphilum fumarolicum]TFE70361.1 chromosomal replication initiator DnaA [Candidatus Methylacidiphilum fumarolicum]TFE73959.1 chromosomal replication initiator protein DnaA [Candidatus Methylacidiphilum fumarolicum]TFE74465.1 chromosomal replication initiator protein DnaA [Candidatus Methylacidiphilum fumarolicum]TFE77874.1 c